MSNERLRAAIHQAGIEIDDLARITEVDTKTVRRWVAGRTPRGRYRTRIAQALGKTERELWPEHDLQIAGRDERGEILAAYAHANDLATPDWRALLNQAEVQIDLLDFTLADVLHSTGTIDLLTAKAQAGCEIRLLISAPDSAQLVIAEAEQGKDLSLTDIPESAQDAEHSLTLATSLIATPGIDARTFIAGRFNTILRFDDEMLVTLHLYGTAANRPRCCTSNVTASTAYSSNSPPTTTRSGKTPSPYPSPSTQRSTLWLLSPARGDRSGESPPSGLAPNQRRRAGW